MFVSHSHKVASKVRGKDYRFVYGVCHANTVPSQNSCCLAWCKLNNIFWYICVARGCSPKSFGFCSQLYLSQLIPVVLFLV